MGGGLRKSHFDCLDALLQVSRMCVWVLCLCTWTVGTSVKALMKSSSSMAPALSLDTRKSERLINICAHIEAMLVGLLILVYLIKTH